MSIALWATLISLNLVAAPPKSTHFFPSAITRGTFPVLLSAEGDAGTDSKIWTDDPAFEIVAGPKPGQFLASAKPGCRLGWHVVRLHNKEGVSEPIPVWVDDLANFAETEPNDHHEKAASVLDSIGSVRVHGRLERNGDVDSFRVRVPKGSTLTARVQANRTLNSPMDSTLQIVDPKGFVLAHNDDARGVDPELVWTAPETGDVIVRVFAFPSDPNSTIGFAGGSAYIYSLLISNGPTLDRAVPITPQSAPADIAAFGPNLPAEARARIATGTNDSAFAIGVLQGSEPVEILKSPFPVAVVDIANETKLTPPVLAYGVIHKEETRAKFRFAAKKDEVWIFRIFAKSWESPLDPVLTIRKPDGTVLTEQDDSGNNTRDVDLAWTAPNDGEFLLDVTDLHRRGGPKFAFGLEATNDGLPAELNLAITGLTIKPGDKAEIALNYDKRAAIEAPLKVTFEGLPKGFPELKPGETGAAPPAEPAKKSGRRRRGGNAPDQLAVKIPVSLTAEQAKAVGAWSGPVRIVATDADGKRMPIRFAGTRGTRIGLDHLWLTVIPPEPPKEAAKKDEPKKDK